MTRRGKSARWAEMQRRDPYARRARSSGMRARAAYKLEEIDRKYRLIAPNSRIIDLGAAPGSWSQYAAARLGAGGEIIAVDLLAMAPIETVRFIRGDFIDAKVRAQILEALDGRPADLVLSDLAPNLSGVRDTDQARAAELQGAVLAFCRRGLRPGGALLCKQFAGESAAAVRAQIAADFEQARGIKPDASRPQSKEFYLLARGYQCAVAGGANSPNGIYSAARASAKHSQPLTETAIARQHD